MRRPIEGSVVVITGASSGIGRAAAVAFAREGARVVLAARDGAALDEVACACAAEGAEALAVVTDVSDERAVEALARAAIDRFGRLDTWVNDAGVYQMGTLEDTPMDVFRRIFEVNVLGLVHGCKAALARFRAQGSGVLINVGSAAGKVAYADASAYCASKHAVHALTSSLRQELHGTDIHACLIAPATVDTPLFQHAANFTGREIQATKPIYDPERVAAAIVDCARSPRAEVLIGGAPRAMTLMARVAPRLFERVQPRLVEEEHLGDAPAASGPGNLYEAHEPHAVRGGWSHRGSLRSLVGLIVMTAALAAAVGMLV
jgi:NADP-dependent 3-hydroxy acid dehydrogenase YdfG